MLRERGPVLAKLDVLYQFNEKYAPYAGISLTSLFENNRAFENITVYVFAEDVTEYSMDLFNKLVQKYGRKICFIDTKEIIKEMQDLGIPKYRGSYTTNMKMFAPKYMSKEVNRLLYLDSDTIICGSLEKLITIDMESKPIAMVLDSLGIKHKVIVGLKKEDAYYNGGVMLFDIEQWNKSRCTERIVAHAKHVRAHYICPDQDLINVVLHGEIKRLGAEYNFQPIHSAYTYNQYYKYFGYQNYYSSKELIWALQHLKILHTFRYLGEFPWHKDNLHPHTPYFNKYMAISLWSNYKKEETDWNGLTFKFERWLYRHLPRTFFLPVFKLGFDIFSMKAERDSLKNRENKNT